MNADADDFEAVAADLDRFEHVSGVVLWLMVTLDGACMSLYQDNQQPPWTGDDRTDRAFAARICAGCPVQLQCLELELRASGDQTVGVWGALPAEDIRALHPLWRRRRADRAGDAEQDGGER